MPGKSIPGKGTASIIKPLRQEQLWHVGGGVITEEHIGAEVRESKPDHGNLIKTLNFVLCKVCWKAMRRF